MSDLDRELQALITMVDATATFQPHENLRMLRWLLGRLGIEKDMANQLRADGIRAKESR